MPDHRTPSDQPLCRTDVTADDLAREADRAILYGAILAARRPNVRLKPAVAEAARALAPAVQAFLEGQDNEQAAYALAYAQACGAEAFLRSKRST
jgi:hypothetical protein